MPFSTAIAVYPPTWLELSTASQLQSVADDAQPGFVYPESCIIQERERAREIRAQERHESNQDLLRRAGSSLAASPPASTPLCPSASPSSLAASLSEISLSTTTTTTTTPRSRALRASMDVQPRPSLRGPAPALGARAAPSGIQFGAIDDGAYEGSDEMMQ